VPREIQSQESALRVNETSSQAACDDAAGDGRAVNLGDRLTAILEAGLTVPAATEIAAPFLPALSDPSRGVQAVVLYGSVLWKTVRGATSQPDFIAIVDGPQSWSPRVGDRLWRVVLPPSVYCLRADGATAKVSVVTAGALVAQTSARARDLHLAGRLSKRVALVWARDARARAAVVEAQRAALMTTARLALSRFDGPVALDDFLRTLLGLSYESEIRIAEPGKVAALFEVERAHYRAVGRALLGALGATPVDVTATAFRLPDGVAASPSATRRVLRRSRRRAFLRWPKYLATYDGWLDYLLQKLARSGTPVILTDRQRRHPFIFALPVLFRMVRTGRVG